MTPVERVLAVLNGQKPDRVPVSFWYHFAAHQFAGPAAVQAHLDHWKRFDLDFLKVMNDNPYPLEGTIGGVRDLARLDVLRGDEAGFGKQLELVAALHRAVAGQVLLSTTLFNAWATLRNLISPPVEHLPPDLGATARDVPGDQIRAMVDEDAGAVARALQVIGTSLANFARRCLEAGADGIYLSVRDDWVDDAAHPGLYERMVRQTDREILAAASAGRLNILHVCGRPVGFDTFATYPVHALSWADRAAGPSIAAVRGKIKPALCAGLDNQQTLPTGTPEECAAEARDAVRQAGNHPLLLAPGCTYNPQRVPEANLRAALQAVRAGQGGTRGVPVTAP